MNSILFRHASADDADKVYSLYKSLVGTTYCAWDDTYPARENVTDDIAAQALYVMFDGTELVAAGTIRLCEEHNEFSCWSPMKNPCDLLRIGVSKKYQGRGVGRLMMEHLLKEAKLVAYDGMRILVAKTNLPAVKLYKNLGAEYKGDVFSYNIDWFCYELLF